MTKLKAGSSVDAWCTRCQLILSHTIEAVVGVAIKRVACNTCQGKHRYRAQAPGTSTTATRSLKAPPTSRAAHSYGTLLQNRDLSTAVPYTFQTRYPAGALLKHPNFGLGVVTADKGGNKIEVSFELGSKVLIHGR